jgi:hypothetical protein
MIDRVRPAAVFWQRSGPVDRPCDTRLRFGGMVTNEGLPYGSGIKRFLTSGFEDAVLIAVKRAKDLADDLAAFRRLRDIGVVVG